MTYGQDDPNYYVMGAPGTHETSYINPSNPMQSGWSPASSIKESLGAYQASTSVTSWLLVAGGVAILYFVGKRRRWW